MTSYDVLVVGAGPAGLSAALVLARCRRSVLVCAWEDRRNAASTGIHGLLTREGCQPADFIAAAEQISLATRP